jgi:pimeloyl-ACP methyl ester carboxylesterase
MRKWVLPGLVIAGLVAALAVCAPRLPPGAGRTIARLRSGTVTGVVTGQSGFARSGAVRIWFEALPPVGAERGVVLLNIALGASSLYWPPAFLRALSAAGYRVVRYDQRGTGASSRMPDWTSRHPYSLIEMAGDAVAVLDELRIDRAHVIGLSLGGFIAQEIAIGYHDRVQSLTLMSTSADPTDSTMPGPDFWALILSAIAGLPLLRYRLLGGEANLVKEVIAGLVAQRGADPVDVEEWTKIVLYDRRERGGFALPVLRQHQVAVTVTRSRYPLVEAITAPTLVVHGERDHFLPIEHGRQLVAAIPSASGLWLKDAGHPFPYPDMVTVTRAITSHLHAASPNLSDPTRDGLD